GVRGLTKVASAEWGKYGITVNTLAPSVRTSMFESWLEELTPEQRAQQLDLVPMRRFGDAETDIGAVAGMLG
ncbi:SDR family oxidoreductase, partial [Bacillus sp. S34]|nr:SDR family oxidoreductase [Bacillus sp. S34]